MTANVLALYGPALAGLRWVPVSGGFSGALVWRGDDFALKAYPPHVPPEHVSQVHAWMRQVAHLPFVPAVIPTTRHATLTTHAGRVWELVRWMPGSPGVTPAQLPHAVEALAQLHRTWEPRPPQLAPCPGVGRRLDVLRSWRPPADATLRRAADVVTRLAPHAVRALEPWATRPVPVQPCLCDVHADHVLFDGDHVSGVVDYGAMKIDHVAVDLARFLGSAALSEQEFVWAVSEYRALGGPVDPELVRLLDLSGVVCALAVWCSRRAEVASATHVRNRMMRLVARAEMFTPVHFLLPA